MISNNDKLLTIYQQYKDTYHLLMDDAEKYVYKYIKKMYDKYHVIIVIGAFTEYNPKKLYQLHLDQMILNKFVMTTIIGAPENILKYIQAECTSKHYQFKTTLDIISCSADVDSNAKKIAEQYENLIKNYKETPEKKYLTKDGRDISWRAKEYDLDGYETGEWDEIDDEDDEDLDFEE